MPDAVTFAAATFALLAAPGPTNVLLASAGATVGRRALFLLPAEAAGYVVAIGLLVLLAGPVLAASPLFLVALKFAVAGWLFCASISLWRRGARRLRAGPLVEARAVFVTTLLNPKGLVVAFVLMPATADGYEALIGRLAGLSALTALTGALWIAGGTALARAGAAPYAARTTAAMLGGFAAFLVGSNVAQILR